MDKQEIIKDAERAYQFGDKQLALQLYKKLESIDEEGAVMQGLRGASGRFHEMATALNPFATEQDIENRRAEKEWITQHPAAMVGQAGADLAASIPAVMIAPEVAGTIAGSGLLSAAQNHLTTVGNIDEKNNAGIAGLIGGAAGQAIGNTVAKTVPSLYNLGKGVAGRFTEKGQEKAASRILQKVVEEQNIQPVVSRLNAASAPLPDYVPTSAEVARNGGIAALQRGIAESNPAAYSDRALSQNDAIIKALGGISKTEDDLNKAIALRGSNANAAYASAGDQAVTINSELARILSTPSVRSAQDVPISPYKMDNGVPVNNVITGQRVPNEVQVKDLHNLKINLDRDANFNPTSSADSRDQAAIISAKKQLVDLLEQQSPAYKQAREGFIADSTPINQMQIGKELINRVQPALADFGAGGRMTGATYARAIRDAKGNFVKNTNGGIDKKLSDVMSGEQMGTIKNVGKALAGRSSAESLGRGTGSNTFQNFAMDDLSSQAGLPGGVVSWLLTKPPLLKGLLKGADDEIKGKLANALLDPKYTAQLLSMPGDTMPELIKLLKNKNIRPIPGVMGANLASDYEKDY